MQSLTPRQKRMKCKTDQACRLRYVAAGLRSDGKPRAQRKPCGCLHGYCRKCIRPGNNKVWSDTEVAAMKRDYDSGMSRGAVERKHGVGHKGLQEIFARRGFSLRPPTHTPKRDPKTGKIFPHVPKTAEQIEAMIGALQRLRIPEDLKHEWRLWSLEKRAAFVKRLREKFPSNRPTTEFIGVEPFEYGHPEAHAIAKRMNAGRISRNKVIALKPCSEGVIWNGRLFFWDKQNDYVAGHAESKAEKGIFRAILKRIIYEQHFCPLERDAIVTQTDGNKNNFDPGNLTLISRAQNALRNSIPNRLKKDPANPELLAKAKLRMDRMLTTRAANKTRRARGATAVLLQNFQGGQTYNVFDALNRRNS